MASCTAVPKGVMGSRTNVVSMSEILDRPENILCYLKNLEDNDDPFFAHAKGAVVFKRRREWKGYEEGWL